MIGGWAFPHGSAPNADKKFHLLLPLKHIFNIFNDYPKISSGRQTFRFVRSRNDNDCLIIADDNTTANIEISEMDLKIKHIFPNDLIKERLLKAMSSDLPIFKPFRRWEMHEMPSLITGAKRELWSVKSSGAMEKPRYVLVFFQTDRRNILSANPVLFDNTDILSIQTTLNGEFYPSERMSLDFKNDDYVEAFFNYGEFNPSYANVSKNQPILNYNKFKDHALFVINCAHQDKAIKSSTVDIRLDIESNSGFPANTRAYCIIICDSSFEFLPLSERVTNII